LNDAESDLRKDLSNFNASKLIGSNIDSYHKNPSHQRNLVPNLAGSHEATLEIGVRTMSFVANPIEVDGKRHPPRVKLFLNKAWGCPKWSSFSESMMVDTSPKDPTELSNCHRLGQLLIKKQLAMMNGRISKP
jgi:hypothetical protein